MNTDKKCDELLDDILKELSLTKEQGIEISKKLGEQTDCMSDTAVKLDKIEEETEISTWYINYLKATFGKIYKKCHNFPKKIKNSSIRRRLRLKADLILFKSRQEKVPVKEPYVPNDKLSQVSNMINDIKYISTINSNELDKQNKILEYNTELADSNEEKIFNNRLKIRKILD